MNEISRFLYAPTRELIRALVRDEHLSDDLTQQFFVDVVLWRKLIEGADREKGRLRTLVRQSARNFVKDHWRRQSVRAVVHDGPSLDASLLNAACDEPDPALAAFETAWLDGLCTEACLRCEVHFRSIGLAGHWTLFERARLHPETRAAERPANLAQIMHEHGFQTVNQARGALDTVFKRLRALLVEVAGAASLNEADREEQLRALRGGGMEL